MNTSHAPLVSVVMGAFNEEARLEATVTSILEQTLTDFEFIAVDDGSTDRTAEILDRLASNDERLRVIHRENRGLTRTLIEGCSLASGELIARQDAGDVSLTKRLEVQAEFLQRQTDAVMVGCGVEFVTPNDEVLFKHARPGRILDEGLRRLAVTEIKGPPHHGGTMFRRSAYLTCGGYRPQFQVAQDMDLWLRLSELGCCLGNAEVLYRASVEPGSISVTRGPDQFYFGELAIESAKLRRNGYDDSSLFVNLSPPSTRSKSNKRKNDSDYYYFLGSNLCGSDKAAARKYLSKALMRNPLQLKALLKRISLMFS